MDKTGQYVIQPEVLFAHAYMLGLDRRRPGAVHPLPPLEPAEVAAWIADRAFTAVETWDSTFRRDLGAFEVAVSRLRPRVAWLYTHPTTRDTATQFCRMARRAGATVIAAGPDALLRPSLYLRSGADAVVLGEGENATLDLVLALRANDYRPDSDVLSRIPGTCWMDQHGTLRYSAGAERLVPIEELPRPYRDPEVTRVHLDRWLTLGAGSQLAIRSARGCPISCGFCTNTVFGRPYRRRTPADVVSEMMDLLDRFPVDRFVFTDEVFLFDPTWIADFCDAIEQSGREVEFEASAHPANLDEASVERLARVGCVRLELDAASGSSRLMKALSWSYEPASVYRAATTVRSVGIELGLQVLVGLPGETRADLDQTLQMVSIVEPHGVEVTRVDPDSPALFRKDWARVVEGPVADRAAKDGVLPSAVLDAAVGWLDSRGAKGNGSVSSRLVRSARRPLLRAAVRALPGRRRR
ncbi:MAG: radical SAM protein [Deltaproteobacteria bacterium]|nr:radical SAM protein [Deltaproteobacteria bacterium]